MTKELSQKYKVTGTNRDKIAKNAQKQVIFCAFNPKYEANNLRIGCLYLNYSRLKLLVPMVFFETTIDFHQFKTFEKEMKVVQKG